MASASRGDIDRQLSGYILDANQFHPGAGQKIQRGRVNPVGIGIHQPRNTRIDQHFGAVQTGEMRHVTVSSLGSLAEDRCLDDGIDLGMHRTDAMSIHHQVADVVTVLQPCRLTVVTGCDDVLLAHQHGSNHGAVAGTAQRYIFRNFHKIRIPGWPLFALPAVKIVLVFTPG